jgi:hypothetical protein
MKMSTARVGTALALLIGEGSTSEPHCPAARLTLVVI